MGFISQYASGKQFPGQDEGVRKWRQVFGGPVDKENPRPPSGDGWGRSVTSTSLAQKRLLQAMRSMAPGGWSDDRYEQSRHFTGINYIAIHRICMQLQRSEFQVFKEDQNHPDGKRPISQFDPPEGGRFCRPWDLVNLLKKPNPQDSWGKMMYRWGQQLRLTGMALTWMVPNQAGYPMEIYSIPTAIAIPQPAVNPDYPDGYYRIQPVYPYGPFSSYPTPNTAVGAAIPAQWMLRFLYPHPILRYDGYSPLTAMRLETDEFESIGRSRWYKMKKSINPSGILRMDEMEGAPQQLPEAELERIHAEWENESQGPENHGKLIVCPPGSALEEWGARPGEMDYPQSWEQLAGFILGGGHGITKPAAGMIEDASYSTLFATLKQLYLITLEPDVEDIASYLTRHLAPFFGDDLIVEIRCKRIDDHEILFQKLNLAITTNAITVNQLLKALDLPVTQEPWGEERVGMPAMPTLPGTPGAEGPAQSQNAGAPAPPPLNGTGPAGPPAETNEEPDEIERSRPSPGPLGRGSLGPRKRLSTEYRNKVMNLLSTRNGNSHVKTKNLKNGRKK